MEEERVNGEMPEADTDTVVESEETTGGSADETTDVGENISNTTEEREGKGAKSAVLADLARERDARQAADSARKAAEAKAAESSQKIADLTKKVKEFEDRDKSEAQRQADMIDELKAQIAQKESDLAAANLASLKAKYAAQESVPMDNIVGATEDEISASAKGLAEWRDANKTSRKPTPPTASGLKSGASATGDHPTDAKERAAVALRQFRRGGV